MTACPYVISTVLIASYLIGLFTPLLADHITRRLARSRTIRRARLPVARIIEIDHTGRVVAGLRAKRPRMVVPVRRGS
jgi:hypothetical protein